MPPETPWATVTTAANHLMAEIVRGELEASGISVMLAGESYATAWGLADPVDVLVQADRLEEARAVLEANAAAAADDDATVEGGDEDPVP